MVSRSFLMFKMVSFFSNGNDWEDREKTDYRQNDFQNVSQ